MDEPSTPPLSRNEGIKAGSRYLRGSIAEGLAELATGAISEDDQQLTKFHGLYLQDDRDLRPERGKKFLEKAYSFMCRLRIPAGEITPEQWLKLDHIADEFANGTIRLTTRETIQFHGIIKGNLKASIQAMNAALLDSIAACGDVNRNVMATYDPARARLTRELHGLATALSTHLMPRTRGYHEIWLDGEPVIEAEEDEPIYGRTYLPRKFKMAIALPPLNDVDVFAHDFGLIAIVEDGAIAGYNLVVGGGMGMTHGDVSTFPRTGDVIGFFEPDEAVRAGEVVVTVQRDFGNRRERKHARTKYTVETMGVAAFKAEVEARLGHRLAPARPFAFERTGDPIGWHASEDGLHHCTLFVENGRIGGALKAALAEVARTHRGAFVATANQNLAIARVPAAERAAIEAILAAHGIGAPSGGIRKNAMACVALPTCGLALAESERYLPSLLTKLDALLAENGLGEDEIVIRMTGCPNGCARPYLAEIGFVGRGPGTYNLYLGAAFDGSRLSKLYRADVGEAAILAELGALFAGYAADRQAGERFGDWTIRAGHVRPTLAGREFHA